jgi:uncharacterized protein (TIGR02246 family)
LRDSRARGQFAAFLGGEMTMAKFAATFALLGATLAMTVSACGKQAPAAGGDAASVEAALKADQKAWLDAFKNRDLEALARHYAGDAVFASSAGPPASGSTEIRRIYANWLTDKNIKITLDSDKIDVAASGDLAYSRGHFSEHYTDPKTGKVMTDSGAFLSVYKKQDDGSWKMVEDFAVTDPATVKAVPPAKPATRAKMVSF